MCKNLKCENVTNVTTATYVKNKNAKYKNSTSYVKKKKNVTNVKKYRVTHEKYFRINAKTKKKSHKCKIPKNHKSKKKWEEFYLNTTQGRIGSAWFLDSSNLHVGVGVRFDLLLFFFLHSLMNLFILRYHVLKGFNVCTRNVEQTVLMRRLISLGATHATELGFPGPAFGLRLTGQINNITVFSSCYYGISIKCVSIN